MALDRTTGWSRRRLMRSSAVALTGGLLAACSPSGGGEGGTGTVGAPARIGPGTTITYLGNHNAAEAQVVQPQMMSFEQRSPGAKVEVTNLTAAYEEKLQTMLASGTPPDMFRTGGSNWAQLANQGAMA